MRHVPELLKSRGSGGHAEAMTVRVRPRPSPRGWKCGQPYHALTRSRVLQVHPRNRPCLPACLPAPAPGPARSAEQVQDKLENWEGREGTGRLNWMP